MRTRERGFTLVEVAITVGIVAIFAALGYWMFAMRPGSLRHAVDEYDAALGVAKALAASSGNGATMVFAPSGNGFSLRVYRGRPTAANAVTPTNTFAVASDAAISEATLGKPPFAIFFDSRGYATGKAGYPQIDTQGTVSFPVIAQQPPCPGSGIAFTFTSPQGVADTRNLACYSPMVAGTGVANPSPTPNAPRISPHAMIAHWTSDRNGALKFRVAEFGYKHWYAKGDTACDSIATYAQPYTPYHAPTDPNEATLAPLPPANTPYTFPDTKVNPDQPIAPFELWPLQGQPGVCTLNVVDDYGQSITASVQIMGDLTPDQVSLTFASPTAAAQTVTLSKTWDSEALQLNIGGNCLGVVTWNWQSGSTPASANTTPATATMQVTPQKSGSCKLQVTDQYGEPVVVIPINVASPTPKPQAFQSWPASLVLGQNGGQLGYTSGSVATLSYSPFNVRFAPVLNALLGGGVAMAAYNGICYARAFQSGTSGPPDTSLPQSVADTLGGIKLTTDGCILNANGSAPYGQSAPGVGTPTGLIVAYEPSVQSGTFSLPPGNACSSYASFGAWNPNNGYSVPQALLPASGTSQGQCTVILSDGSGSQATPAPDKGSVAVAVQTGGNCSLVNGWHWGTRSIQNADGSFSASGSGWGADYICPNVSDSYGTCAHVAPDGSCGKIKNVPWTWNMQEIIGFLTPVVSSTPTFPEPTTAPPWSVSIGFGCDGPTPDYNVQLPGSTLLAGDDTVQDPYGGCTPYHPGDIGGTYGANEDPYEFPW